MAATQKFTYSRIYGFDNPVVYIADADGINVGYITMRDYDTLTHFITMLKNMDAHTAEGESHE